MFSGIVEDLGKVVRFERRSAGATLGVEAGKLGPECGIGDSVAVNGVCLTVVSVEGATLGFDLSDETLAVTDLGDIAVGDHINLELALRIGERLGGHFVSGHVDEVGRILGRDDDDEFSTFTIGVSDALARLIVHKGSIAVDGISLTVAKVLPSAIEVAIIPHTLKVTTLGEKQAGAPVNLEADMIGKYVAKLLAPQSAE